MPKNISYCSRKELVSNVTPNSISSQNITVGYGNEIHHRCSQILPHHTNILVQKREQLVYWVERLLGTGWT